MKYLLGVLLVGIVSVTSCKDDKKTTANGSNSSEVEVMQPKDTLYRFKLNLEKGQVYPLNLVSTNNIQTQEQDRKMTVTAQSNIDSEYEVIDFKNGIYTLKATFKRFQENQSLSTGQKSSFDTNLPAPKDTMTLPTYNFRKAFINQSYTIEMDTLANVKKILGVKELVNHVINQLVKNEPKVNKAELQKVVQAGMSEEMLKLQFENYFGFIPKDTAVYKGYRWVDKKSKSQANMKVNNQFEISRLDMGIVEVKITNTVSGGQTQTPQKGVKLVDQFNGSQNGHYRVNRKTGWIHSLELVEDRTSTRSISAQGKTMKASQKAKVTTKING